MTESSRRNFLKYAGAGAAAVGVAAVAPAAAANAETTDRSTEAAQKLPKSGPTSFMAYVGDVHKGEVTMLLDGHEVVVKDADLVARLAQAVDKNTSGKAQSTTV